MPPYTEQQRAAARAFLDAGGSMWEVVCCPSCGAELDYDEYLCDDGDEVCSWACAKHCGWDSSTERS